MTNYYEEKIKNCLAIVKREKIMREYVFKNQPDKQKRKMSEMDFVIDFLNEIASKMKDKQSKLF